eukprot:CAMPEP_0202947184 /NCGR_PEP_ID=MMETSP1395-20130829/11055_1 /ASSEMBLY_ACC=CAM_ASM_000871 /TAXON_ID=5961 /ORGANISM="Blepharisma japonicum, Strain Stock R1072" /LENGTH=439 /DNA_ID=CAMNT_0049648271 /DNA_START=141 /DNA_END=1460 /DNA_ORIENTATION=+
MPNTFNMRYFTKTLYYLNGGSKGPIFFYTGNEAPVESFMNNTGFIDYLAQSLNALVVYAEHRYFGKSLPFGGKSFTSPSYTKYLSPHQALADYAYLITYLKTKYNNAPVIVFGGSYGGMLSAWMRIKYPDLVLGAIAASAPIMAFNGTADQNGFNAIVTRDFATADKEKSGSECAAYIATAFDYLYQVQGDLTTYYNLSMTFQTCDALITKSDVDALIGYIQTAFTYMAMTDYPYATNFLNPMPGHPVNASCQAYTDTNMADTWEVLQATFNAINIYYNYTGESQCSDIFGTGTGNLGSANGWDYLSCSTLNIPIGGSKSTSMFGNQPWNQQAQNQYCQQTWGVTPQINYANIFYGTNVNPMIPLRDVSNIVFSNGGLDPWQFGSVTKSTNPNIVAFVMEGAAHHLDLRYPNQLDPPEVSSGRATEQATIEYWLGINQN